MFQIFVGSLAGTICKNVILPIWIAKHFWGRPHELFEETMLRAEQFLNWPFGCFPDFLIMRHSWNLTDRKKGPLICVAKLDSHTLLSQSSWAELSWAPVKLTISRFSPVPPRLTILFLVVFTRSVGSRYHPEKLRMPAVFINADWWHSITNF